MKTKTMYVADDGTPFNSMKECIAYEKSMNKYVVIYKDEEIHQVRREFDNEPSAKRFISNSLHDCYEDNILGNFKLVHCGKTVEFNSDELSKFVPAHYNIDGNKLNEIFQLAVARDAEIPGYTLHGDYYLADEVITNKTWKEACEMKEVITLPNGKTVIARTLSKEELETIPKEERKIDENGHWWYWTRTPYDSSDAWGVRYNGDFNDYNFDSSNDSGGARLGFKNPFAN